MSSCHILAIDRSFYPSYKGNMKLVNQLVSLRQFIYFSQLKNCIAYLKFILEKFPRVGFSFCTIKKAQIFCLFLLKNVFNKHQTTDDLLLQRQKKTKRSYRIFTTQSVEKKNMNKATCNKRNSCVFLLSSIRMKGMIPRGVLLLQILLKPS